VVATLPGRDECPGCRLSALFSMAMMVARDTRRISFSHRVGSTTRLERANHLVSCVFHARSHDVWSTWLPCRDVEKAGRTGPTARVRRAATAVCTTLGMQMG